MACRRWTLCALCCLLLSWTVQARFIVESGGLKIKFPDAAKKAFPDGFDTSLANFGSPKYGGSIVGSLLYVDKDWGEDFECKPIPCKYGCQDFRDATPPFSLSGSYIMMVDRGPEEPGMQPCKFALKVWNAQQAGAIGVIVVNYEDRSTTMEAPDDEDRSLKYLQNITIPAAFVQKSVGDSLKQLIKPQRDLPHPKVLVSLDWTDLLPRNEVVQWEFWSNSNDMCGPVCDVQKEFIKEFQPVAMEFEQQGWTKFTPHYLVWVCPDSYHQSAECRSQCIRQGRYCTPDPDGDIQKGYSGKDIVQENLRQLCVFKLANESGKPWLWWEYVTKFGDECSMVDRTYDEDCAEKVFTEIGGETWSSMSALRQCIGDPDSDSPSDIMDAEMAGQRGSSSEGEVYILPTIRVNTGQYRGKLSYHEVLRAICSGFNRHNEPAACNRVGEDDCRVGAAGQRDCAAQTDGKTMCKETFAGYQCVCGSGFISHVDAATGEETCLDINECLTIDAAQLDANCTCERCACKNIFGSYQCLTDLADECAVNNGGCWKGDYTVKGSRQTFSACKDELESYKYAAAHGQDVSQMPLHTCQCPPCFEQKGSGNSATCAPKCSLDSCDLVTGVCAPGSGASGGSQLLSVLLTVALVCGVLGAVGYGVYQFRIRSAMHQEIRAIMRQYMPLQETDGNGGGAAAASNGLEPLNGLDK